MQQTTCKTGQATDKRQHATKSVRHATCNATRCDAGQATDSAHHGTGDTGAGNRNQTPCNGERATCNKERARRHDPTVSNAADDHWKMCNRQSTTCNMHRGKCDRRHANATGKIRLTTRVQHTTSRQHAPCSGQYVANNTDMQSARQHATCSMQHAARSRPQATWKRHRTACNGQRASVSRRHARGREHMRDATRKHTASPHSVCGEQRAAHKQQHARSIVLDNQCATRHRRHTQDATYDRCRSMQQTHAEPTPRSRH
jgi:hypothetical protein